MHSEMCARHPMAFEYGPLLFAFPIPEYWRSVKGSPRTPLPEGWSFPDEKTMEDFQQAGAEALDAEIPSESGRAKTLMTAMDMTTGTTVQITGSWNSTPAGEMIEEAADMAMRWSLWLSTVPP